MSFLQRLSLTRKDRERKEKLDFEHQRMDKSEDDKALLPTERKKEATKQYLELKSLVKIPEGFLFDEKIIQEADEAQLNKIENTLRGIWSNPTIPTVGFEWVLEVLSKLAEELKKTDLKNSVDLKNSFERALLRSYASALNGVKSSASAKAMSMFDMRESQLQDKKTLEKKKKETEKKEKKREKRKERTQKIGKRKKENREKA